MIKFRCPSCQTKLGVPDDYANRRVRCNKCGQVCVVPNLPAQTPGIASSLPLPKTPAAPAVKQTAPVNPPVQPKQERSTQELDHLDFVDDSQMNIEEDHNAEVLRKIHQAQMVRQKVKGSPAKSPKEPSARTIRPERPGFSFSLTNIVPDVLHFPLSIVLALAAMTAVIAIWIFMSTSIENPHSLGFFALFVPWAAAVSIRLLSVNRTFVLGFLAAVIGVAGIGLSRVVIAKQVVIPWMHKTAEREILKELDTVLLDPKKQIPQEQSAKSITRDGDFMTCVALVAAVDQDGADPVVARKLALDVLRTSNKTNFIEMVSQAGTGAASIEASMQDQPEMSDEESAVMDKAYEHLGKWEEPGDMLKAARKYYPAFKHLTAQCETLKILDDPERTFRYAVVSSLDIFDVAWMMGGICGAFVIASFEL